MPVLALVAGTSGIASTFSWLEPIRPVFLAITVVVLAFAWFTVLKPKQQVECDCESDTKPKFTQSKSWLGIITAFSVIMLAFPYFSSAFYSDSKQVEHQVTEDLVSANFSVTEMTCNACETFVRHEVMGLEGVIDSDVSFQKGTVNVKFDTTRTDYAAVQRVINSTGYTVTSIKEE
jgi:copper chaperone CopZ